MSDTNLLADEIAALAPADQERVREYIAFLRWRAGQASSPVARPVQAERLWCYNLLEHFPEADVSASRHAGGMEVKIAEATVGGERRPALWQHPPVVGESLVEYHVPIPADLAAPGARLRFSIGIRDGADAPDHLVAFRVRVDGWQIWSRAAWPRTWQPFEIALPFQAGNVLRLTFATDAL
ncbi:MAG: hypothetical protein N2439_02630, partial [Anaerolineae bacterium]|nr:hypothetical protein [Anaerolineae bacterium]